MEMTCGEILAAVKGRLLTRGQLEKQVNRVLIDSRQIGPDDFFVPLRGSRTDGHQYIDSAAKQGAAGCFVSLTANVALPAGISVIGVADPLAALQDLSRIYRRRFDIPVVAVTGSVGKTTTKDLISSLLSVCYNTLKTEGNLNNEIGLPLILTRLTKEHQAAVLEMGMSGPGEIDRLAALAQPDVGVITNIGESHIESLGSRENIARAKCELLSHLLPRGTAVVNGDEPLLRPYISRLTSRVITFGFAAGNAIRCAAITEDHTGKVVHIEQDGYDQLEIIPPLPGRHSIYNLMAAIAVARVLKMTDSQIKDGLSDIAVTSMRLEMAETPAGLHIINDAYNASPTSMAAALEVLAEKAKNSAKIAVLGDMLELGDMEEEGHRQVGRLAAGHNLDILVVLGERARLIAGGALDAGFPAAKIYFCRTHGEAAAIIKQVARTGDWVLLKGSRGMRMEKVLDALSEG